MTGPERQMLQETHDAVLQIATRCDVCQQQIKRHSNLLEGNGNGVVYRLGVLEGHAKWVKVQTATAVLFCSAVLLAALKSYMGW